MSVPIITLTSQFKTTVISHPPEISRSSRDASFSSYLDGAGENFVLKLGSKSTPNDHIFLGENKSDDKELDVFDAEKYFNEANHCPKVVAKTLSPTHHPKKDEIFTIKEHPAKATSSIRSESSLNSRSALLHAIPKNQQQPKKPHKKSFLASIGCNCSCADINSVDIEDHTSENKSNQGHKTDRFVIDYDFVKTDGPERKFFPVFNPKPGMKTRVEENIITKRSKSLEVFGSRAPENGKMCSGLEKKLTMMTWDAIAPGILAEDIKKIPSIPSEMLGDDSDSDDSSDLFEIESLSRGEAHINPFLSRQASDGCKSPSEASIEWSVVTASVADGEELIGSNSNTCPKKIGINPKIGPFREMPRLRSGILSGCMSQKAVRIDDGDHAHIGNEHGFGSARRNLRMESFTSRFHDESKVPGFDARNRQRSSSFDSRVLSRQQRSGDPAHLLYA